MTSRAKNARRIVLAWLVGSPIAPLVTAFSAFHDHQLRWLAEREWDRRMMMEGIKWQRTAILTGLLGTILGAVLTMITAYLLK